MNTAQTVIELIRKNSPVAASLTMGYMVTRGQQRVNFSDHYGDGSWNTPRTISERRTRSGRVETQIVQYADGSRIRYTYSDRNGARYTNATPKGDR